MAAELVAGFSQGELPVQEEAWRRRQQGRLLTKRVAAVLRSQEAYLEPPDQKEHPERKAHRYLLERRDHLDYAGAQKTTCPSAQGK